MPTNQTYITLKLLSCLPALLLSYKIWTLNSRKTGLIYIGSVFNLLQKIHCLSLNLWTVHFLQIPFPKSNFIHFSPSFANITMPSPNLHSDTSLSPLILLTSLLPSTSTQHITFHLSPFILQILFHKSL